MISNRVKRNIWCTLTVLSIFAVVDRIIRVADGSIEWWNVITAVVMTALAARFYWIFRREVRRGNLFGPCERHRLEKATPEE